MTRTDEPSTLEGLKLEGLTAEALATRVQEGSKAAFAELANRFGPRLFNYFRQRILSREDCEDLVQETLVKTYQNIHRFRRAGTFSTWLYTIGTRQMVDFFRIRERVRTERIPDDLPAEGDPFDAAVREDEKSRIWGHARMLPHRQYDALWLRYAEEMPVREIARVLGLSRVHVKVLLFRARARLAKLGLSGEAEREGEEAVKPCGKLCSVDKV